MAKGKNKLTAVALKAATGNVVQDGGGLMLVRSATGQKWTYRYMLAKRRRDMGLGAYPDVSMAEARKERDKWAAVLQTGIDPITERNRRAEEVERLAQVSAGPTLSELVAKVFESRKASLRGAGERGKWMSPLDVHVLPRIGNRRVAELTQVDIRDVLAPIWKTKHVTASKAIMRLAIVFKAGKLEGLQIDPFTIDAAKHLLGTVPQTATPTPATRWQDVPELFAKLGENPTASNQCLRLIILTAVRGDAARGARFDEIDGRIWTVPAERVKGTEGKVEPFRVPLSDAALGIVEACHDTAVDGILFPCRKHSGRYGPVTANAIEKALTTIGEGGRPHGFRTSFRTWVQDTEAETFDVAETALGHRYGTSVERSYARSDLLDRRAALAAKWAEFVTSTAT